MTDGEAAGAGAGGAASSTAGGGFLEQPKANTGRAARMMKALTKLIQVKSGSRRIVIPGARFASTVATTLMPKLIEPVPSTNSEAIQ